MSGWQGRVKTAAVLLPAVYLAVAYAPPVLFFILIAVLIGVAQHEFYRFFFREGGPLSIAVGLALGLVVLGGFYDRAAPSAGYPGAVLAGVIVAALSYELFFHREIRNALAEASVILLGVFYVDWLLGHLIPLRGLSSGRSFIFFLLLVTWGGDAGAYYAGKNLGRRKLYPSVSPNKTLEGAIGGWVASLSLAVLSRELFLPVLSISDALWLGALLGVVGQAGDLVESMFKRCAGVKDSGGLIPSHGGLLDKLDSLAFNAPVLFYYLLLVKGYGSMAITI
jgi:phosphatidate cytidylyltransferase